MKKRLLGLLLGIGLLIGGCGSAESEKQPEQKENQAAAVQEEVLLPQPVEISMEDNYRTWYEVFVYSFYDGDGDGIGDLNGLTQKLDYINDGNPKTTADLGCTGIWLMPIMPSATYHKYDVADYYGIDSEYGTMEEFEVFMEACSERGIKVILDLVINHTSSRHPWFQEACEYLRDLGQGEVDSEKCPYVDYYHFSKEKKNGYSPVPGSDIWFYEAQFWSEMPDLNLYNEQLREEISKIADFWLKKGVRGFRLDAAKEFETGSDTSNIEILSWFTEMIKKKDETAYLVAEVWTDMDTYAKYYSSGIDSVFNFEFSGSDGIIASAVKGSIPASSYAKALEQIEEKFSGCNEAYIDAPFYTNHDMGRSAGYYSGESAPAQTKLSGALNLLMSGSAFIYYGEELGMKGAGKDENKRAPMCFYTDKNTAGMCEGPPGMDSIKMKYGSLEEQEKELDSVYNYYKQAIYLRNCYPVLVKGRVRNIEAYSSEQVAAFSKTRDEEELLVFCNLSGEAATVELNTAAKIVAALYTDETKGMMEDSRLTIPAYGIMLLQKEN